MLWLHVDLLGDLTSLAGQARMGHGGHISSCMFPYIQYLARMRHLEARVPGWAMPCIASNTCWPENSRADVPQEELVELVSWRLELACRAATPRQVSCHEGVVQDGGDSSSSGIETVRGRSIRGHVACQGVWQP